MSELSKQLRDASERPTRNDLSIGHYWNFCSDAADQIERLERELAQAIAEGRRQMREEAATRYVMPNKNRPSAGEAWAAYREAVEDFRAAIRAIPL